jgi:sucrose-6F-phosphate phosphohydrolase
MPGFKRVALFCSDLDGTLLGRGEASLDFRRRWDSLGDDRPILVYSTGRLIDDARRVVRAGGLPDPDHFTGGVGTVIVDEREGRTAAGFEAALADGWDRGRVVEIVRTFPAIEEQPAEQQNPCKSSWFWHGADETDLDRLRAALAAGGVDAQVIYSSSRDLDVLPRAANKGNALRWLCHRLGVALDQAVVAGDTGNDASMFGLPGVRGIVPVNAEPGLLAAVRGTDTYRAAGECAAGVIEGLVHHGVFAASTDS